MIDNVAKANETPPIPGKRLIPQLAIGCLLFAAVMGFGTYFVAQLMTPGLKKRNDEYMKTHRPKDIGQVPPTAPATVR
jgi:hypothetical protein